METKLAASLGYPTTNPFGAPIPGYSEGLDPPAVKPLSETSPGETTVVEQVPEEDLRLLEFFDDKGVRPGAGLEVMEIAPYKGTITLLVNGADVVLGTEVAAMVMVRT